MNDQAKLASSIINALNRSGKFQSINLIGSVADSTHDSISDIDILIKDESRSPWANVQLASQVIENIFGVSLRDWAGSLIPQKYVISHFLPEQPIFWWVDLGCLPCISYNDISRNNIEESFNTHVAKLLVMNAKYLLRGSKELLRISELYQKVYRDQKVPDDQFSRFNEVHMAIDYSTLSKEFYEKTKVLMQEVANKSMN